MYVSIYLSVYIIYISLLRIYLSVSLSIYLYIYTFILACIIICVFIYPCIVFIYSFICASIKYLGICESMYESTYPVFNVSLYHCIIVSLYHCITESMSVWVYVCMYVCIPASWRSSITTNCLSWWVGTTHIDVHTVHSIDCKSILSMTSLFRLVTYPMYLLLSRCTHQPRYSLCSSCSSRQLGANPKPYIHTRREGLNQC